MAYTIASSPFGAGSANQSPAYTANFIPEIWSGKLVEKFYAATVLAAIANTDYEGEIANQGDTVKIRTRPDIAIADYEVNMDLLITRPSATPTSLSIDKGKYFNLALDDVMDVQADIDLMSTWSEDAAESMKVVIDTQVLRALSTDTDIAATNRGLTAGANSGNLRLGVVGGATFGQYITAAGAGVQDGIALATAESVISFIVKCGQVLDENNIPESGRWMVIPAWMAAMIKKSELRDASISGDSTSIARNGRLGMIDRFTLYMSNNLPNGAVSGILGITGGVAGDWAVFFGTNAALTFASQFTKMETIRSERSFSDLLRGLQVYGWKVVNGKAIGRAIVRQS